MFLKWILIILSSVFLTLFPGFDLAQAKSQSSDALAVIDGKPITMQMFKNEMARQPGRFATIKEKEALLEEMVRFEMVYVAARRAGYDQAPQILASLKQIMVNKFRQDRFKPRLTELKVTDNELEDYYQKHLMDFATPKMVRAAVIQIRVPDRASKEKRAKLFQRAEAARAEALKLNPSTSSFGGVAVKYSNHQSTRYRGGDTEWLQTGKSNRHWEKEVLKAIFSISEIGKVSPVISTKTGYYIIKLMQIKQSAERPFAAVKNRIRHLVLEHKKTRLEHEFYDELKADIPVKVCRSLLKAIKVPAAGSEKKRGAPPALPGQ